MGAAEFSLGLPRRVNIVYGGRYALAKLGRGDCPVEAAAACELLSSPRRRNHADNKWYLQCTSKEHDKSGSTTLCVVLNDHHPQKFLCARDAVELVAGAKDESRLWEIEYPHDNPLRIDAVKPAFRLRSFSRPGKPYLVADPDNGGVALQLERPDTLWQFFDAAVSSTCCGEQSQLRRAPSAMLNAWQLQLVDGRLEDVFSAQPETQDGFRSYPGLGVFFSIGESLCNPTEVAQPPSTLYDVYLALLGQDSKFRQRLCDGVNPEVAEVHRLQNQPGCGIARAECLASIPVLGKRTYQETLRIALCREGTVSTLAIQVAGTLKIGFPVGDFLTETLHLFTQVGDYGPVRLQSWGMAQPGAQQRKALDGMKAKQREYLANVHQAVREAVPGTPGARVRGPPSGRAAPADDAAPSRPRPMEAPRAEACVQGRSAGSPPSSTACGREGGGWQRAWLSWQECFSGGCLAGIRRSVSAPEGLLLALLSLLLDL